MPTSQSTRGNDGERFLPKSKTFFSTPTGPMLSSGAAVRGSEKKFCVRLQSLPIVPACALGRRHELLLLTESLKSSLEPPFVVPELPRSSPRGVSYSGKILGQIWTCEAAGLAAPTHLRPPTHRLLHTAALGAGSDQIHHGSYKRAQNSLKMAHGRALQLHKINELACQLWQESARHIYAPGGPAQAICRSRLGTSFTIKR